MKSVSFPALLVILAALAATPAAAQLRSTIPTPVQPPHISAPPGGLTLSTPATSPLQQQMQDDYATQRESGTAADAAAEPIGFDARGVGHQPRA